MTPEMQTLLLHILGTVPPPGTTTLEAIFRNRALQEQFSLMALQAAEQKWPGFEKIVSGLMQQERALTGEPGPEA